MNVFSWVGLANVAVGVVLAAVGFLFLSGDDRGGLIATGLFLIPFGLIFYFVGRRVGSFRGIRPKLLESGVPARGLVKRLWETGVTVNENPVLGFEVEVVGDQLAAYTAQVQQSIPRMLLGAVLPGSVLAVEYDRNDPSQIAIDWTVVPEAPGFAGAESEDEDDPLQALPARRRSMESLLAGGRRARGTIVSMRRMGRIGDLGLADAGDERADDELFLIELEVATPWGDDVTARVLHRVPDELVGRVGPGLRVDVAVDRDNPTAEVAIDWSTARGR